MPPVGRRSACSSRRSVAHPVDQSISRSSRRSRPPFDCHRRIIGFFARSRPLAGWQRGGPGCVTVSVRYKHTCIYPLNVSWPRFRFATIFPNLFCALSEHQQLSLAKLIQAARHILYRRRNMVFSNPAWVPPIPGEVPDSVPLSTFSLRGSDDVAGQDASRALLADGLSGKTFSRETLRQRVESLARALAQRLGWSPNEGSPWDKVVAIHSLNSVGAAVHAVQIAADY